MNTLTLVPIGGLGQRLCAMASAVELAGGGLCDLRIAWPRTQYCRERFSDLFLPVPMLQKGSIELLKNGHSIAEFRQEAGVGNNGVRIGGNNAGMADNNAKIEDNNGGREDDNTRREENDARVGDSGAGQIEFAEARFRDLPSGRHNFWLPTLARAGRFRFQTSFFRPQDTARLTHALMEGDAYAASGFQLGKYSPDLVRALFHPHPFILDAAERLASAFTPSTVGVTIRRIDIRSEIQELPLSVFTDLLDEMVENGSVDSFFLATDDAKVRRRMCQRYGSRLILREEHVNANAGNEKRWHFCARRAARYDMYDAAVEMWAMSRAHLVIGSNRSAFAHVASDLGGVPLRTVGGVAQG